MWLVLLGTPDNAFHAREANNQISLAANASLVWSFALSSLVMVGKEGQDDICSGLVGEDDGRLES